MLSKLLTELSRELGHLVKESGSRDPCPTRRVSSGVVEFKGKRLIDFTSFDYLSLLRNERIVRKVHEALEQSPIGSASSRSVSGSDPLHVNAERRLSMFLGCESSLLFSSRNQATFSVITSLCSERDVIFAEEDSSLPVSDAAYLVNASFVAFPSRKLGALATELERAKDARRRVVFLDSLSAARGDLLPVGEAIAICERFGANLILDETAALSVIGLRGAGSMELEPVASHGKILCYLNGLGSLCGSSLACVSGPLAFVNLILQRSRAVRYELAPAPVLVASVLAAIDVAELLTATRSHILTLAGHMEVEISRLSKVLPSLSHSPIVAVPCASVRQAEGLSLALQTRGVLAEAIHHSGILSQRGSVRFVLNAEHSLEQVDSALAALSDVMGRVPS